MKNKQEKIKKRYEKCVICGKRKEDVIRREDVAQSELQGRTIFNPICDRCNKESVRS